MKATRFYTLLALLLMAGGVRAQQWHELNTGVVEDLYNVCCIDTNTVFVCGQNGLILKTEDGGNSWQEKYRNEGWEIFSVRFSDDRNGYALVWDENRFFTMQTEDYGESWFPTTRDYSLTRSFGGNRYGTLTWMGYGKPMELYLTDNGIIYIIDFGHLYKSTDGGETFEFADLGLREGGWEAYFEDNIGLVIGCDRYLENVMRVMKTDDYGEHWENIANYEFSSYKLGSVYFEDERRIKVFGEFYNEYGQCYGVIETNDCFEHITTSDYNSYYVPYFDIDFSNERGCYINSWEYDKDPYIESVAYVTEDSGASWFKVSHGIDNYEFLYCVSVTGSDIFVSSQNGRLYKYDSTPVQGVEENKETGISIYPNPGKDVLNIRTALQDAWVEVYDVNGRMVYRQEIAESITTINTTNWSEGTYVWKVYASGGGPSTGSGTASSTTLAETGKWVKE